MPLTNTSIANEKERKERKQREETRTEGVLNAQFGCEKLPLVSNDKLPVA